MQHISDKTCKSCGLTFPGGPRAWYCPTCRIERKRETERRHKQRKRAGTARSVGDPAICIDCGAIYAFYIGASDRCWECTQKRKKSVDRQRSKEWNARNKDKYLKAKREFERKKRESAAEIKINEKYISFDRGKGRYRVVVKGAHVGYFIDLNAAISARDAHINGADGLKNRT